MYINMKNMVIFNTYPINHPNHLHHLILTESKHVPGIILTEGLHKLSISELIMLDVCFSANKRNKRNLLYASQPEVVSAVAL